MSAPSRQPDFLAIMGASQPSSSAPRPAKTSAAPTLKGAASKVSGRASTSKQSASSERCDLVGSLLRTALISELGALTPSSMRWRRSATPAGRSWFVLETLAPITNVPAPGSLDATSSRLGTPVSGRSVRSTAFMEGRVPTMREAVVSMLGTPTANAAPRGSVLRREKDRMKSAQDDFDRTPTMGEVVHFLLPTPLARDLQGGARYDPDGKRGISMREVMTPAALDRWARETLPTPTKRDKRMDAWSPAYDKRKSPTMDAVLDGAQTDKAPDKWAYARQIAALLTEAGLTGPSNTLPTTYGWMMGFPPGWLGRAFMSAMARGSLLPASSSKRSATPSSRKSLKP